MQDGRWSAAWVAVNRSRCRGPVRYASEVGDEVSEVIRGEISEAIRGEISAVDKPGRRFKAR